MELLVFADERKNLLDRWDYIVIGIVPKYLFHDLLQDLRMPRAKHKYDGEFKFAELNAKGTGTKLEVAKDWVDLVYGECDKKPKRLFFKVMGIDREKISFRLFGDGDTAYGKYSNLYNRFFRTTLLGALNFFFPDPEGLTIAGIYHDTEGNLQAHDYFDWHVIEKIGRMEKRITFDCDKVEFVDSDHRTERNYPEYSEMIQFIDMLVGATSYCIHVTNRGNFGQRECASRILSLTRDILLDPYAKESPYSYCRQYDIGHFPKDSLTALDEDRVPGEFYRLNCREFEELLSRQLGLGF